MVFVTVFQRQLSHFYTTWELPFVLPSTASIVVIVITLILHCACTLGLLNALNNSAQLKTMSILSAIFAIVLFPLLMRLEARLFLSGIDTGADALQAQLILRQLILNAQIIRNLAISILLIAASMAFYHCKYGIPHEAERG